MTISSICALLRKTLPQSWVVYARRKKRDFLYGKFTRSALDSSKFILDKNATGIGYLDRIAEEDDALVMEGWGLLEENSKKNLPESFLFFAGHTLLGSCRPSCKRDDVAHYIGDETPPCCGFKVFIPFSLLPDTKSNPKVFMLTRDNRIIPLHNNPTQIRSGTPKRKKHLPEQPKVFFYGVPNFAYVIPKPDMTAEDILVQSGGNTGNLFFLRSLLRHVGGMVEYRRYLAGECQVALFCLANYISEERAGPDPLIMSVLELHKDLPLCVVGVGAQASASNPTLRLQPDMIRFLKTISERSVSIGVRGEYTAQCLFDLGIRNVRVIGCPSLFFHGPHAPVVQKNDFSEEMRCATAVTAYMWEHLLEPDTFKIMRHAIQSETPLILQSFSPLIDVALGNPSEESWAECKKYFTMLGFRGTDHELYSRLRSILKVFYDPSEWVASLKNYDFFYGSRIHGAVAAMLAGTPALVLSHDSRTQELAQTLHIPVMPMQQFEPSKRQQVYDALQYDAFTKNYTRLYNNYLDFLEENNVPHQCSRTTSHNPRQGGTIS